MHTLAGLAINLIIIWLLLFVFARPVGWLLSSGFVHPELRAREPSVHVLDQPTLEREQRRGDPGERGPRGRREHLGVHVRGDPLRRTHVCRAGGGVAPDARDRVGARSASAPPRTGPGTCRASDGSRTATVQILRQPRLVDAVPTTRSTPRSRRRPTRPAPTIVVDRQPHVVTPSAASPPLRPRASTSGSKHALRVSERPHIRQFSGTTGRPEVEIDGSDVLYGFLLLGLALLIYVVKIFHNPVGVIDEDHWVQPWAAGVQLPHHRNSPRRRPHARRVHRAAVVRAGDPTMGLVDLRARAAGRAGRRDRAGLGSAFVALLAAVGLSASSVVLTLSRKLTSKPMLAAKIFAVALLLGVGFVTTISLIQMAAANGPTGRLTGLQPRADHHAVPGLREVAPRHLAARAHEPRRRARVVDVPVLPAPPLTGVRPAPPGRRHRRAAPLRDPGPLRPQRRRRRSPTGC